MRKKKVFIFKSAFHIYLLYICIYILFFKYSYLFNIKNISRSMKFQIILLRGRSVNVRLHWQLKTRDLWLRQNSDCLFLFQLVFFIITFSCKRNFKLWWFHRKDPVPKIQMYASKFFIWFSWENLSIDFLIYLLIANLLIITFQQRQTEKTLAIRHRAEIRGPIEGPLKPREHHSTIVSKV